MKISVGVSNRHVHLTDKDVEELFGKDYKLTKRRDLSQKGQYACEEVVTIKTNKNEIAHVRVLGPTRKYTQVEVSKTDAEFLGLNPPVRDSGDLENSESITIINGDKEIFRENSCIIAEVHIHANSNDIINYNDKDIVSVVTKDNKVIDNVRIKKDDTYTLELHIDKDVSKEYSLENGDIVILETR